MFLKERIRGDRIRIYVWPPKNNEFFRPDGVGEVDDGLRVLALIARVAANRLTVTLPRKTRTTTPDYSPVKLNRQDSPVKM